MTTHLYRLKILVRFLFSFFFFVVTACCPDKAKTDTDQTAALSEQTERYLLGIRIDTLQIENGKIRQGASLSSLLQPYGIKALTIHELVQKAKPVFDIRRIVSGKPYITLSTCDSIPSLLYFIYEDRPNDFVVIQLKDSIAVYRAQKEISIQQKIAEGSIQHSLWMSMKENDYNPNLALELSDIYAWQIDFFGIQKGDSYRILYDEQYVDDTVSIGLGKIHAACFHHAGKAYYAFPFQQDGYLEYFDEKGINLRKAFLKAPLRYSRISSRFSSGRMHPILRIRRPHYGVDYAAPTGTPVVSIGSGTVVAKAYQKNGGGNYVSIKHNGTYTTTYMHLSGYAANLRIGQKVSQGEVIGYVGSTGLSSGPHLDFRVYKNGSPIDPLKMESPPSTPLKPELRDSFELVKKRLIEQLFSTDSLSCSSDSLFKIIE